jgi:hypothetical protein
VVFFHKARHFVGLAQYLAKDVERVSSRILPPLCVQKCKDCLSRNPRKIVSQELLPESLQESYGYTLQECLRRMSFDSSSQHCLRDLRHRSVLQGCFPSAFK